MREKGREREREKEGERDKGDSEKEVKPLNQGKKLYFLFFKATNHEIHMQT